MSQMFETLLIGSERFQRTMDAIGRFSRRPRLAMRDMAAVMENETEKNFAQEGRPKWQPMAPATIIKRIGGKKGYKKDGDMTARSKRILGELKILQDSGLLAGSVHSAYGNDYAVVGAARPYARIQQLGGRAGRNNKVTIPSRPYLPFDKNFKLQPETEKELLKSGLKHLQQAAE
jgi:phage virion morphogenesis protein